MYLKENLRESRRFYHRLAEPGWFEFKTTISIIKTLKEIGIKDISYGRAIHLEEKMQARPKKEALASYARTISEESFDISEILEGFTGAVAVIDTKKAWA